MHFLERFIFSFICLTTFAQIIICKSTGKSIKYLELDSEEIDSTEFGVKPGHQSTTCPCGWTNKIKSRIVGGSRASVNEFNFPVGLIIHDMGDQLPYCGGSIITQYHVLTAAHCTKRTLWEGKPMAVVIGQHDFTLFTYKLANTTQIIKVKKYINHEKYEYGENFYDISLLVLEQKIHFNEIIGPVCLPEVNYDLDLKYVKAIGWGRVSQTGAQSKVLKKVNVRVIPFDDCEDVLNRLYTKDPHQLCLFSRQKGFCMGDSGGPIVWLNPQTNRYTLVGLPSFVVSCASNVLPSVATRVGKFINWINENVEKTNPDGKICTAKV